MADVAACRMGDLWHTAYVSQGDFVWCIRRSITPKAGSAVGASVPSLKNGLVSTFSARALKVAALSSLIGFDHHRGQA
jgi:hypothetical protein